jgi:hypothetical protein
MSKPRTYPATLQLELFTTCLPIPRWDRLPQAVRSQTTQLLARLLRSYRDACRHDAHDREVADE